MLLLGRVAGYVLRELLQRRRSQQCRLSSAQALLALRDWGGFLGDGLARNAIAVMDDVTRTSSAIDLVLFIF
jgi:hypothetical protein